MLEVTNNDCDEMGNRKIEKTKLSKNFPPSEHNERKKIINETEQTPR